MFSGFDCCATSLLLGHDSREKHNLQAIEWNYGSCIGDHSGRLSDSDSTPMYISELQQAHRASRGTSMQTHALTQPFFMGKPDDSAKSAKVSFIFGDAPLENVNPQHLGYQRLMEDIPEALDDQQPLYLHQEDYKPLDSCLDMDSFQYGNHMVYGDGKMFGTVEGIEEPLLHDICYAETTDDAEDEDDISCEDDMSMMAMADSRERALSLLSLSESSDDIIDLTSLPPPLEGNDVEDNDVLLQSLNSAIAAPPAGFRDSSDEDEHQGDLSREKRTLDIPVSLIDSVPTNMDRGTDEVLDDAVVSTLQALEALAASEDQSHPQSDNNSGSYSIVTFIH